MFHVAFLGRLRGPRFSLSCSARSYRARAGSWSGREEWEVSTAAGRTPRFRRSRSAAGCRCRHATWYHAHD